MAKLFIGGGSVGKLTVNGTKVQFTVTAQTKAKAAKAELEYEVEFCDGEKRSIFEILELSRRKESCCLAHNKTFDKEVKSVGKFKGNIYRTAW